MAMSLFRSGMLMISALTFSAGLAVPARAELSKEVLHLLVETADGICPSVDASGKKMSAEASGDIKAGLSGLSKHLADLSGNGSGKVAIEEHSGVLQEELAEALKGVRDCRLKVFEVLAKSISISPSQASESRDPDGLYQHGEKVADVQGAVVKQANSMVQFQTIRTAGKADPSRDVEYREWVLNCPGLPAPPSNAIVGDFHGMAVGPTCTIVKKRDI